MPKVKIITILLNLLVALFNINTPKIYCKTNDFSYYIVSYISCLMKNNTTCQTTKNDTKALLHVVKNNITWAHQPYMAGLKSDHKTAEVWQF